jgi:hypothetical protein
VTIRINLDYVDAYLYRFIYVGEMFLLLAIIDFLFLYYFTIVTYIPLTVYSRKGVAEALQILPKNYQNY